MKSGKQHMKEWRELPNHEKIRMLFKKETYEYLGIYEADTIKRKKKKKKEYPRRTRKLLEIKNAS